MILLDAIPLDVLELTAACYTARCSADAEHHASAALHARLCRHLTQRCDDPTHAGFTTYSPRRLPCYFLTHAHPGRITCRANRSEYFARVWEATRVTTRGCGAADSHSQ